MVEEIEKTTEESSKTGTIFSPEGLVMMSIAILLDLMSIICVFLILAFGIGLLLAKIIYIFGLIIISGWVFFRSGALPGKGKLREKMTKGFTDFAKKHWKKLAGKAIPAIGDALPIWTWTVYSELTGHKLLDLDSLF